MEWLEQNIGTPYPFRLPLESAREVESCIVDAVVSVANDPDYIAITELDVDLGAITLFDGINTISFDDSDSYTRATMGDYEVVQWSKDSATVKLVLHHPDAIDWPVALVDARLNPSCLAYAADRVTNFVAHAYDSSDGQYKDITLGPVVTLLEGYNCKMESSGSHEGSIRMSFAPGNGMGRYDACSDNPTDTLVRTINGIGPDEWGNINIAGDDCVMIVPIANGIEFSSHCHQRCTCQDYASSYAAASQVAGTGNQLTARLVQVRTALGDLVTQYNARKAQFEKLEVLVRMIDQGGWTGCLQVYIGNSTNQAWGNGQSVTFDFSSAAKAGVVRASGLRLRPRLKEWEQVDPTGSWSSGYTIALGSTLQPGQWWAYQMEFKLYDSEDREDNSTVSVQIGVGGISDGATTTITGHMFDDDTDNKLIGAN